MEEGQPVRRWLVAAGLGLGAVFLLFLGRVLPLAGGVMEVLTPLPFILVYLTLGPIASLLTALGVGAFLLLSIGRRLAIVFLMEHALSGLTVGAAMARRLSLPLILFWGVGAMGVGAFLLTLASARDPLALFLSSGTRYLEEGVRELTRLYERMGLGAEELQTLKETATQILGALGAVIPAILGIGALFGVLANYLLAQWILRRRTGHDPVVRPFAQESFPDAMVWALILAGILTVIGIDPLDRVGTNLLLMVSACYLVQGLAIIRFFFERGRLPAILQAMGFVLLVAQPIFLALVALLGLIDLWVDFRKIKKLTPAT